MKRIVLLLLILLPICMMAQPLKKWLTIGPQEWLIPVDLVVFDPDTLSYEQELFRLMVPENASFAGIFTNLNECSIAYDSVAHQLVSSEVISSREKQTFSIDVNVERALRLHDKSKYKEPIIRRHTMDISDDVAARLIHLWDVAIWTAKEPVPIYKDGQIVYVEICDGTDYEFVAKRKRARSTLDGGLGRAKAFTDFATKLEVAVRKGDRVLVTKLTENIDSITQQFLVMDRMTEQERNEYLENLAREVSENIAPEWLQGDVVSKVSSKQEYFSTSNLPFVQRNVGREFYNVTFCYDEATKAELKYDYATRVRIWADNGEVASIMTGEDWGRVFYETSYEQMKQRGIKREEQMSFVSLKPSILIEKDTECRMKEIELDHIFLQGLDSAYFNRIIEFDKPLEWCANKYEKNPYIAIKTRVDEESNNVIIYFHNNNTVNLTADSTPQFFFEHKGYYCILMDDGLNEWLREPTGKSRLFSFKEYTIPITDDTSSTLVEYDQKHRTFRMMNFAYQTSTCYDDNPNPVTDDRELNIDEKKELLHYLKSRNIDFSNYVVGLFCMIVINEDGSVSPCRLWIPTSSSADQWEEISRALFSFKWKPYLDEDGIPHRYKVTFKYTRSELNNDL